MTAVKKSQKSSVRGKRRVKNARKSTRKFQRPTDGPPPNTGGHNG